MPLRQVGERGRKKFADKAKALELYFARHSYPVYNEAAAPCQICSGFMRLQDADPMHKRKASLGISELDGTGGESPENILAGHRNCHIWADKTLERRRALEDSGVDVIMGGCIQWSQEQRLSLTRFLRTGKDEPNFRLSGSDSGKPAKGPD